MKTKIWVLAVLVIAIALFVMLNISSGQQVEVSKAEKGEIATWVEETGYVQALDELEIQASQSGKIISVSVEVGQKVTDGQELLLIENLDLTYQQDVVLVQIEQLKGELASGQIGLEQSRIDLTEGQKNLQRDLQLFQAGAIAQTEYEASEQKVMSLQKTVTRQELTLQSYNNQLAQQNTLYHDLQFRNKQLIVKSLVAGIILDLPVKKEQSVMAGYTLAQIGNAEALEIKTELLSDDLAEIKIGAKVEITAPILGDAILNGQVKKIYPRAYEKTSALGVIQRRVPVLISLPANERLQPGYEVQVKIQTQLKSNVVILPRTALRTNQQGQDEVLVLVQGRIKHQQVQIGIENQESVEISRGIKAGQSVVRDASTDIKENARVKI